MKRTALIGVAAIVAAASTTSAQIVYQESFETEPGTSYTLSSEFDDGSFDFFGRYMVPDNDNAARDDFQNGWDGDFGIIGQDHDGEGGSSTQSIFIDGIDISGLSDISMIVSLGALNSEPDFTNYEAGNGVRIFAEIDGGGAQLIGEFAPNANGASDLYLDTDGDGIGDGDRLTVDLTDFSFAIAGTGSSLNLQIDLNSDSSFEPLAVDNVRVDAIPAPGALALLGIAGLATRRRR